MKFIEDINPIFQDWLQEQSTTNKRLHLWCLFIDAMKASRAAWIGQRIHDYSLYSSSLKHFLPLFFAWSRKNYDHSVMEELRDNSCYSPYHQHLKDLGTIFGNRNGDEKGYVGLDYILELVNGDIKASSPRVDRKGNTWKKKTSSLVYTSTLLRKFLDWAEVEKKVSKKWKPNKIKINSLRFIIRNWNILGWKTQDAQSNIVINEQRDDVEFELPNYWYSRLIFTQSPTYDKNGELTHWFSKESINLKFLNSREIGQKIINFMVPIVVEKNLMGSLKDLKKKIPKEILKEKPSKIIMKPTTKRRIVKEKTLSSSAKKDNFFYPFSIPFSLSKDGITPVTRPKSKVKDILNEIWPFKIEKECAQSPNIILIDFTAALYLQFPQNLKNLEELTNFFSEKLVNKWIKKGATKIILCLDKNEYAIGAKGVTQVFFLYFFLYFFFFFLFFFFLFFLSFSSWERTFFLNFEKVLKQC